MAKYTQKKFVMTNSMSGKREEFKPMKPPQVLFYSCGPTVYGPIHIGNARALIFADLLFRWLKHIGYDVNFVRNYTDIDDRIIEKANKEGVDHMVICDRYVDYTNEDNRLMGLQAPTRIVRVTETVPEIIEMIQKIIANGHAYVVDGEVLFSIDTFKSYGKLSGKKVEDLVAGARVEVDAKKRSPADFSLWKPQKPGEPFWDSPWGKGRPGWHIECSAMIGRWLGDTIDLHHGGPDLIFPHHENEIAQSECATHKPFCDFWVHHAFLTQGDQKMSKSLGNILPAREFLTTYGGELLKFIYISFHYRSSVPYTHEMMAQALGELERVYLAKKWAVEAAAAGASGSSPAWDSLKGKSAEVFAKIEDEMFMDLNTSGAMGHLFSLIRDINRVETQAGGKPGVPAPATAERRVVAQEFLALLENSLAPLLNVFAENAPQMLDKIEQIRRVRATAAGKADGALSDAEIQALIDERNQARKDKNFKRSDDIRNELDSKGIVLIDNPQGTMWRYKG